MISVALQIIIRDTGTLDTISALIAALAKRKTKAKIVIVFNMAIPIYI